MKFLQRKRISPIRLAVGDSITLTNGEQELLTHHAAEPMVVDEVAVFETDAAENEQYGFRAAIGGLFAERK